MNRKGNIIYEPFPTVGIVFYKDHVKLAAILFDYIACWESDKIIPEDIRYQLKYSADIQHRLEPIQEEYVEDCLMQEDKKRVNDFLGYYSNEYIFEKLGAIQGHKVIPIPIFHPIGFYTPTNKNQVQSKQVEIELINAPVINTEGVEWNQILDAKKDKDFKRKVRSFSLFINENYKDQSIEYITESLYFKVEEYKEALNKHGFTYGNSVIKEVVNSKSLWGTTTLVLLSSIMASPGFALTTGIIGGMIELGNLSMKISEMERSLDELQNQSDLSLILEIEKMTTHKK